MNRLSEILGRPEPSMAVAITEPLDAGHIDSVAAASDVFEFRADKFPSFDPKYLTEQIGRLAALPLFLTVRYEAEGGSWVEDEGARLSLFERLMALSYVDGVDIETAASIAPEVIGIAKSNDKIVVASSHDFSNTPPTEKLEEGLNEAQKMGADYIKFAVSANTSEEFQRLAKFTLNHRDDNIIVVAMDKYGPLSRIVLPGLGSHLTYAFPGEVAIAPGQLGFRETNELLAKLYPDYSSSLK